MAATFSDLKSSVIDNDLCCGCGACVGICPADALSIDILVSHEPVLDGAKCTDCGLCRSVCPGKGYPIVKMSNESCDEKARMTPERGPVREYLLGHSTDPDIRFRSASGGIATALMIHLLESGQVDSVLVIGMENERPAPRITSDIKTVIDSAGSKYGPVPMLAALIRGLKDRPRRIAATFTPCQLAGWRAASAALPQLRQSSVTAVGLFCGYIQSYDSLTGIASTLGIDYPGGAVFTHWRYGAYPGSARFVLPDGSVAEKHIYQSYDVAVPHYSLDRCFLCPDGGNWTADLTLGDIHSGGVDETVIVCRTARGAQILESARAAGRISTVVMPPAQVERCVIRHITRSKMLPAIACIAWRRGKGLAVPDFDYDEARLMRGRMRQRAVLWRWKYRLTLWVRTGWRRRYLLARPRLLEMTGHFIYNLPGTLPGWKLLLRMRESLKRRRHGA